MKFVLGEPIVKKSALAAFAVFVALFSALMFHNPAQAYPNVQASLSAVGDDTVLVSGEEFAVLASSSAECDWALTWGGISKAVRGTQFQTTFIAPKVTETSTVKLTGVCTYTDPSRSDRAAAKSTIEPAALEYTVRPATTAPNNGASLAGTGGPNRMVLLSGVALLVAGATVAMVARRRAEHAELTA